MTANLNQIPLPFFLVSLLENGGNFMLSMVMHFQHSMSKSENKIILHVFPDNFYFNKNTLGAMEMAQSVK